jgi:chromosome segregation ATPase
MDIEKELDKANQERNEIIERINELDRQKQGLLQEALRLEGEIRVLKRLSDE